MQNILRIDSSARYQKSDSRERADILIRHMSKSEGDISVRVRDVAQGLPFIDHQWVAAKGVPKSELTSKQRDALSMSSELIKELKECNTVLITCPIYNFGIPACLKAWLDLVILPQRTVKITDEGFEGLLSRKRAVVLFASSGTEIGSDMDFASPYLKYILNFVGIKDVIILGGPHDVDERVLLRDYAANR